MSCTIATKECCRKCHSEGRPVVGLWKIIEVNPRHPGPGLCVLGAMLMGFAVAYVTRFLMSALAPGNETLSYWVVVGTSVATVTLGISYCRLRVLVCVRCGAVCRIGFGRSVPFAWLERSQVVLHCTRCDYSLIGLDGIARCPECGKRFPAEWLKVTRASCDQSTIGVTYRVVADP